MEVVYSVSDIDVSTLPSLPSNPPIITAREFNSKACKAIWDLDGTSYHINALLSPY